MTIPFKEIVFPEEIGLDAVGGRGWDTDVVITRGGQRSVNQNWPVPLGAWEVSLINKTPAEMRAYEGFVHAMRGSFYGFRFLDPRDHMIRSVGMRRLTSTTFQIRQRFPAPGDKAFYINVKKPKYKDPLRVVTFGSTPITDFSVDETTGVVTIASAGSTNVTPRYTGEYHIPVWLVTEKLDVRYVDPRFYSAESIQLKELVL